MLLMNNSTLQYLPDLQALHNFNFMLISHAGIPQDAHISSASSVASMLIMNAAVINYQHGQQEQLMEKSLRRSSRQKILLSLLGTKQG